MIDYKEKNFTWDSDFTKLTPFERRELEEAERSIKEEGTVSHSDIDWD